MGQSLALGLLAFVVYMAMDYLTNGMLRRSGLLGRLGMFEADSSATLIKALKFALIVAVSALTGKKWIVFLATLLPGIGFAVQDMSSSKDVSSLLAGTKLAGEAHNRETVVLVTFVEAIVYAGLVAFACTRAVDWLMKMMDSSRKEEKPT